MVGLRGSKARRWRVGSGRVQISMKFSGSGRVQFDFRRVGSGRVLNFGPVDITDVEWDERRAHYFWLHPKGASALQVGLTQPNSQFNTCELFATGLHSALSHFLTYTFPFRSWVMCVTYSYSIYVRTVIYNVAVVPSHKIFCNGLVYSTIVKAYCTSCNVYDTQTLAATELRAVHKTPRLSALR